MNQIKTNILLKIQELFLSKGWDFKNGNEMPLSLFNRFCERLKLLTDEQQLLVIELTHDYTWVELANYLERFYDSLIALGDEVFNSYDQIFVYPLLSPHKATPSKTKSAGFLHYMFEADNYTWLSDKFIPDSSLKVLQNNFNNQNSVLLLVDDFVGSGDTSISICTEYLNVETNHGGISSKNIKIVSIAAQRQGVIAVKEALDIDVVSAMIFEKGISDKYSDIDRTAKINLMEAIEDAIKVEQDFKFGFRKSEALITMMHKTPNNTFPIYWLETRNKVAPFPRKKKFKANG